MIYIYIEQLIGFSVYFSFGFTIMLFIQFKQKRNHTSRSFPSLSRFAVLGVVLLTTIYVQSLFTRFDTSLSPLLREPYSGNEIPGMIDQTPVKPHREDVEQRTV